MTTLPTEDRTIFAQHIPWMSLKAVNITTSRTGDTHKAIVMLVDGQNIETVLMGNARDEWTICVSSQVGCAMKCSFCATGTMGFIRNLSYDEIIDQYRFWNTWMHEKGFPGRISNIVFMGMGEPLANYDSVKKALVTLLEYTDIGATRITVSTVGVLPQLEKLLHDKQWPHVRLAISLHSASQSERPAIVPTTAPGFHDKLAQWAHHYIEKLGNRRHHITFEYVMLEGVNDRPQDADTLARYVSSIGHIKVNLIPYNTTAAGYIRSHQDRMDTFLAALARAGVVATVRKTMGDDISAACGQLVLSKAS